MPTDPLAHKALLLDALLFELYGGPFIPFSNRDPLSELVNALLSHRTKNRVTRAAYAALTDRYSDWEAVIEADPNELVATISAVTYPEVKGPRIQQALDYIRHTNEAGLSLNFLAELSVPAGRAWLEQIPGVGAKTSAAVLSFSRLRMTALVVDTHHLRVAQRVGLVPPKATLDKAAAILQGYLPEDWDGQRVYDSHQGFMRHGQKVCYWRDPACSRCAIRAHCVYYATITGE